MGDNIDIAAMSQPFAHASLASNYGTFISLPDGFLWPLKPNPPLHRADREFLKMNAL